MSLAPLAQWAKDQDDALAELLGGTSHTEPLFECTGPSAPRQFLGIDDFLPGPGISAVWDNTTYRLTPADQSKLVMHTEPGLGRMVTAFDTEVAAETERLTAAVIERERTFLHGYPDT